MDSQSKNTGTDIADHRLSSNAMETGGIAGCLNTTGSSVAYGGRLTWIDIFAENGYRVVVPDGLSSLRLEGPVLECGTGKRLKYEGSSLAAEETQESPCSRKCDRPFYENFYELYKSYTALPDGVPKADPFTLLFGSDEELSESDDETVIGREYKGDVLRGSAELFSEVCGSKIPTIGDNMSILINDFAAFSGCDEESSSFDDEMVIGRDYKGVTLT